MSLTSWLRGLAGRCRPDVSPGGSTVLRHEAEDENARLGFTRGPVDAWREERERVYIEMFGEYDHVAHELIPRIPHIDVYLFPPREVRDFHTLITGGMSDLRMKVPRAAREVARAELVMYAAEPADEYLELLNFLAHMPHDFRTFLCEGHTVPNGDPAEPFFDDSQLQVAMLREPPLEPDRRLAERLSYKGDAVHLWWVVLLTAAECQLKLDQGYEALCEVLDRQGCPITVDRARPSYV